MVDEADRQAVEALLGRPVQGDFEIVVRHADGSPVVLRNAPLMRDGTPMPTRYWLVGEPERTWMSRLEAAGGVNQAEAEVDPDELAAAHARYAAERDAAIPADHDGHRPAVASAAPASGSSASTPTTPGTSPAATTRSAAGSSSTSTTSCPDGRATPSPGW